MPQYDGSIRINTLIDAKNASSQLIGLANQIQKTADKIASLRSKMDTLKDVRIPTQEYKDIDADISKAEKELQKLIEKQAQMQHEGKDSGVAWERLNERIQASKDYIDYAKIELQELVNTGKAFTLGRDTEQFKNLGRQLQYEENHLAQLNARWSEYSAKQDSVSEKFSKMRTSARKAFNEIHEGTKKSNSSLSSGLKTMLKYSLGIRSLYALFGKLRNAAKEGFANLAQYSDATNKSISMLKSALTQMKNSLATAFAPIVQTAIPYLVQLTRYITYALNAISQFMAVLGGKSTWIRAVEVQEDYAASLEKISEAAKKAFKALAGFDKLNVLARSDSDSSTGVSEISPENMFEEVPVKKELSKLIEIVKDLKEHIKKIIQDFAIGDFFQAGKDVSKLAKSILDFFTKAIKKVNWEKIGENVGKFFAGIDWVGVLKSVGKLIWTALKAALDFWAGAFDAAPLETGIITAIALLKFTGLGSALKNALLPRINEGLGKIREGLTLEKIAIGIAAVFGEFTLISDAFEGLILGSRGVASALAEIVIGAGLAVSALKLIGLSNPWTALITGATALVGAIIGINEARKEAFEKLVENEELEVFGERLSDVTERLNKSAQATKDRMAASMEYVQNAGVGEIQMAKDLADRYFDLYEKENLTNEETEEMQRLAQLLIEKAPELNQYYDEQTGLINGTRDAINDVIDARLREIQLNAVSEELTEAYKKRREALKDVEEAANTAASAQEELSRLQNEYNELTARINATTAYEDIGALLSQGVEKLDSATVSQDLLNALTKAGVDETENLVDLYGQLYDIATKFGTEEMVYLPKAAEDLYDIEKLYDVFLLKHKEALDTLENSKSAYDTVETTISDLSQMMSEGMQGVGEDFGEGYEKGILSKVKDVEDAAEDIGKSGIESLRKAQDSNSPSKETMKLGEDFVEGYNKGINDNIFSTKNVVSDYISQIVKKFSELIPLLSNVGKDSMSSLLDGIISMENRLYQKINDITRNISNAMANISSGMAATSGGSLNTGFSMYGIEGFSSISNRIPCLASGAVIRGGDPFMAVLGDQPKGQTNIEAPLATIEKAVTNAIRKNGGAGGGEYTFVAQLNGKTIFEETVKQDQIYRKSKGRSGFSY